MVIVDQRGAGLSTPGLRCRESINAFKQSIIRTDSPEDESAFYNRSIIACNDRLQRNNVPVQDFNTYQSARDFLAIMDSLPYASWSTLATSYATVIIQAIELLHPRYFDRIVLDSPIPVNYQEPYTIESSIELIDRILKLCNQSL
ncbi:hypothetical protein AB833_00640 [Chromatiales bacterium (ex Bugula neritina AB1)]|nr:hypothetical protein AB833_00640 [Chromatiales bacterium (ex Bugula neritina AB1)]